MTDCVDHFQEHALRLSSLEKEVDGAKARLDEHSDRLTKGDTQFIRMENRIERLTDTVSVQTRVFMWVGGVIGLGLLGTAGSALIYVIGLMAKSHA
jgi:hypothetical protein